MSKRPLAVVLITALVTFFMTLFALEFSSADEKTLAFCPDSIAASQNAFMEPCSEK